MVSAHLHRTHPEANMARFYSVEVAATLFGQVSVLRTWGRIGTRGRTSIETRVSAAEAETCGKPASRRMSRRNPDIQHRRSHHPARGLRPVEQARIRIEEAFGWARTTAGMAQTVYRGIEKVRSRFILTMATNNLAGLPRLLAA